MIQLNNHPYTSTSWSYRTLQESSHDQFHIMATLTRLMCFSFSPGDPISLSLVSVFKLIIPRCSLTRRSRWVQRAFSSRYCTSFSDCTMSNTVPSRRELASADNKSYGRRCWYFLQNIHMSIWCITNYWHNHCSSRPQPPTNHAYLFLSKMIKYKMCFLQRYFSRHIL